jgi:hypothetical protein
VTRDEQEGLWRDAYAALTPEQRRVADDIGKRSPDQARQHLHWVLELAELVARLQKDGANAPWTVVAMFWIRLQGVFKELPDAYRVVHELALQGPRPRSLIPYGDAIYRTALDVLAALTEEEVLAVDYYRQRSAHLRQDAYRIRLVKDGVREARTLDYIDRTFTVAEVDATLARLVVRHGNEASVAAQVAGKVARSVDELKAALQALHDLPPM